MMKRVLGMSLVVAVALLMVAPGGNAALVFWDDGSAGSVGGDPTAVVGTWNDVSGEVTDAATESIPASPGGGNFIEISRALGGAGTLVGWATSIADASQPVVHYEFDMYVVGKGAGLTYADFELVESAAELGVTHPLGGVSPQMRVSDNGTTYPTLAVSDMYTDPPGAWNVVALGPTVAADAWHHYELDLVIGDIASYFITVDGGTPVNMTAPWGFDGYGTLIPHDETSGVMFSPAGGGAQYYLDNIGLTVTPEPATGLLFLGGGLVLLARRFRCE